MSEEIIDLFLVGYKNFSEAERLGGLDVMAMLGNMVSKVNFEVLLEKINIDVVGVSVLDENFEKASASYLLSFLARFKRKADFSIFHKVLWPQLKDILGMLEKEKEFNFEAYTEKLKVSK